VASPKFTTLACLVFLLCAASNSNALTGTGDAPPFGLNTRWTSAVDDQADLPLRDQLSGCYPNPFNPLTRIRFELARSTAVNLKVYDLQGRLVRTLVAGETLSAGRYVSEWDGQDERGATAAAGIYLYRLVTDDYSGSRRMTLIK
jgi:hypothetical protein